MSGRRPTNEQRRRKKALPRLRYCARAVVSTLFHLAASGKSQRPLSSTRTRKERTGATTTEAQRRGRFHFSDGRRNLLLCCLFAVSFSLSFFLTPLLTSVAEILQPARHEASAPAIGRRRRGSGSGSSRRGRASGSAGVASVCRRCCRRCSSSSRVACCGSSALGRRQAGEEHSCLSACVREGESLWVAAQRSSSPRRAKGDEKRKK